jgi:hypothetical protein
MKRSKMIEKLQSLLDDRHPLDRPIDAIEILDLIEKCEMISWEPEETEDPTDPADDPNYCGAW